MEQGKKLTLEELIAKAEQRKEAKTEYKEVYVKELDGALLLKKLPMSHFLELMDQNDNPESMVASLEFEAQLIYDACPMLHDKALQEAYDCQQPSDIVFRILDDNILSIHALSSAVLDFYGMGDSVRESLKN